MQVSIVILNYNYGRFLAEAIESALHQRHDDYEIVVVDNGSTDNTSEVLEPYLDRVRVVRQPLNIGQGHGYNLGFEAARGKWIMWLDADDMLESDCVSTCMSLVQPDTAKVQFPLWLVDAQARRLGGMTPFLRHEGDVVPLIRRFGHYAGPPGSGNLYLRSAVAPYFPVPTAEWPICTDTVPFVTAPFHGRVVDSGRPLGSYRLHGKASGAVPGYRGNYSVSMGSEVRLIEISRTRTLALLRERSGIDVQGPFLELPAQVRSRIISWRLARECHPFPRDDAASLNQMMADSLRECPGYNALEKAMMRVWAVGVLNGPGPLANRLMSSNRSSALWDRLIHWSRRLGT